MITQLIEEQGTFEKVRDRIAAILKLNIANQMSLATQAGKDASLWDVRIFTERSNPFEEFQDAESAQTPLVNVWYDSSDFDDSGSDPVERQKTNGMFNVDVYACGISLETAEGHSPGDEAAAFALHRAISLIRNILMAGTNTYLGMRGTVWGRKVTAVNIFQPSADDATVQNIIGARIAFRVTFNEVSPQVEAVPLETIALDVYRADNGEILLQTEYHYNGT